MKHACSRLRPWPISAVAGLLLGLIALASPTPASAQQTDAEIACQPDVFRLCEQFVPDRGKITACLRKNRLRLNPECRKVFSGRKSLRRR